MSDSTDCTPLRGTRARQGLCMLAVAGCLAAAAMAQDGPPLPSGLAEPPAGDANASSDAPAGPALPSGLGGEGAGSGPALPSGLGGGDGEGGDDGPGLPSGLGGDDAGTPAAADRRAEEGEPAIEWPDWLDVTGFWELRGGFRTQTDPYQKQASLGETRLQTDLQAMWEDVTFKLVADFLYDAVIEDHELDLEEGRGWVDLRQANVAFTPFSFMDVKAGRQVLTWGTGDLIFLNDLFPKDWQSFFVGRDVEYLKAPSDAVKMSVFTDLANVDVVYVPRFDSDRYIRGRRISYYNSNLGRRAGRDAVVQPQTPNDWFDDDEWHARIWKTIGGYELAAYGYWGYWKSPAGQDSVTFRSTFPRLNVYGASVRGQALGGIGNLEAAYYDSGQDRGGDNPWVRNSEVRLLAGYERDLPQVADDFSFGMQYYLELMMAYDRYVDSLPPGVTPRDRDRHLLTFRVTKQYLQQNLTLELFAFYSPSDSDAYLRPKVSYKIDDHWTVEMGGNVFFGAMEHTFFGQFEKNTNIYGAIRYGF